MSNDAQSALLSQTTAAPNSEAQDSEPSIEPKRRPPLMPLVEPQGGWTDRQLEFKEYMLKQDSREIMDVFPGTSWHPYIYPFITQHKRRPSTKASRVETDLQKPKLVVEVHMARINWDKEGKLKDLTFWPEKRFTMESFKKPSKTFEASFLSGQRRRNFKDFVSDLGMPSAEKETLLKMIEGASSTLFEQCNDREKQDSIGILAQARPQNAAEDRWRGADGAAQESLGGCVRWECLELTVL
jgi:hypothetical protein